MAKTSRLLIGFSTLCLLAVTPAWGQSIYSPPYTFTTLAGAVNGNFGVADGTNNAAQFNGPSAIAVDASGNLYVADTDSHTIREIARMGTNWVTTTIAGTAGSYGIADGTNLAAQFEYPSGIAVDANGILYVADTSNHTIRKITPSGTNWVTTTIAGSAGNYGYSDGTNSDARFYYPANLVVGTNGALYVADSGNDTIRKITPMGANWVTTTIAGLAGSADYADGTNNVARFSNPNGIALGADGDLYVADADNNIIRKITPAGTNWVTTTIAGTAGNLGSADGTNEVAQFNDPFAIAVDGSTNLYVADTYNDTIRKITPSGTNWVTTTLAGVPDNQANADGVGASALFNSPFGIIADHAGNLYVADTLNNTIRQGVLAAVAAPPILSVNFIAPDSVMISWTNTPGYLLQSSDNLATPNWVDYGGVINTTDNVNHVTITPPTGNRFFRLTP